MFDIEEVMDGFFAAQELFFAEMEYYTEQKLEEMYQAEMLKGEF
jgi:hypothetical protein